MVRGLALALMLAGAAMAAPAYAYTSPGAPTGYVSDFAHILRADTIENLNLELQAFDASTTNQIAVVTIPSMGGDYIEDYAVKLFDEWGIGNKERNNGVLLLLTLEERDVRIEVGYGLEGVLPDSMVQAIVANDLVPRLEAGDYDGAITTAVASIKAATRDEYKGSGVGIRGMSVDTLFALIFVPLIIVEWLVAVLARSKSWWAGGVVGVVAGVAAVLVFGIVFMWLGALLVGVLAAFGFLLDYHVSKAYGKAKSAGIHPPWWAGGGGKGGGFGGGFGGFGGGRSGGGGASGGW